MSEKLSGKELCETVSRSLNIMGNEGETIEDFIKCLRETHPTLHQAVGRLVFAIILDASDRYRNNRYDGRNEAFCLKADKIVGDQDKYDFGLPLV